MKFDRKQTLKILTVLEMAIGFSYFYLAIENQAYLVIGLAHVASALVHHWTHEL